MFKKLLFLIIFFPVISFGQLTFNDTLIPELIVSGRSMALGNAFSARVDDSLSGFLNPAGLGTVRKLELRLSDLYFDNDEDLISMTNDDNLFENLLGAVSIDGTRQLMLEFNKPLAFSRFNFVPNLVTRYFSVGYFYSQQTYMTIPPDSASPTFSYIYRQDQGVYLGFNISLFGGVFKLGFTGLYLSRKELSGSAPADEAVVIDDDDYNRGKGYFGIGGFKFTYPVDWLPTFSASYQNLGNRPFENYGAAAVNPYPPNLTFAFSVSPQVGKQLRIHFEGDYVDALRENTSLEDIDRLQLGIEFEYDRSGFLRVGYLDGYFSGGLGFTWPRLTINLSTYGVTATVAPGQNLEDRRYVLSISYGI